MNMVVNKTKKDVAPSKKQPQKVSQRLKNSPSVNGRAQHYILILKQIKHVTIHICTGIRVFQPHDAEHVLCFSSAYRAKAKTAA